MRKTSQDGGDTSSITSGVENEIKKSGAIMKTKKNSIKRKVQNLSNEYDETVIEPLLQNDNERTETANQSAKNLLMTTKTDITSAKGNENNIIVTDNHKTLPANSRIISETTSFTVPSVKDNIVPKCLDNTIGTVHNHMHTNVFASHTLTKSLITPNTQILVEIDGTKQISYSPSPLIFTTAKIHTDGKTQHMEPVQVTPVPILSIIEVSALKAAEVGERVRCKETDQAVASIYSKGSNLKSVVKDQKLNVTTSENNIAPGLISNNVSIKTTTSGYNVQTTQNKISPITKERDFISPLPAADAKISSLTNNVNGKLIGSSFSNDNKVVKEEPISSIKLSQPQSTSSTISQSNIPVKCIPTTSTKTIDGTKKEEQNKKVDSTLVSMIHKLDDSNVMHVKTDINKNIQPINVSNIDPHCSGKSINVKNVIEAPKNEKSLKNHSSSSSNKQLQRQKNTKIDDTNDSDLTSKKSIQKESNSKFMSSSETKISDHNFSNISDNVMKPKSNSGSVNVTTTQSVSKVTATVSITGKPVICLASSTKPIPPNIGTMTTVKSNDIISSQPNDVKTKSSTIIKPSTTTAIIKPIVTKAVTNINKHEPPRGLATVSSAITVVEATTRTASITSSMTKVKTPNTTVSQTTPSIKQPIPSTICATTTLHTISIEKAPISTSSSSLASMSVTKSTTSKDISKPLPSNKNPGTSTTSGAAAKSKMPTKKVVKKQ